jgi:hypothetical protein
MKGLLLALMFVAVNGYAQEAEAHPPIPGGVVGSALGLASQVIDDFMDNTKFKVESTIPLTEFDWQRGTWAAGTAIPVLSLGSHIYLGPAFTTRVDGTGLSKAAIVQGIRLNSLTRPAAQALFEKVLRLDLGKHTMLDFLAKSTSAGVTAGHNFNAVDRKKVVINSYTAFFGLEMAFGPDPNKATAQSVKARRLYFK